MSRPGRSECLACDCHSPRRVSVCARLCLPGPRPPPEASDWPLCLYVQCVNAGMDTLTLARYYCELSLMEMEMVTERGSLLASACLLMALLNKDLGGWVSLSLICFSSVVMSPNMPLNLEVLTLS